MKINTCNIENREFIIQIGTNALENWNLIDISDNLDLWFHVEGFPSGHVVVKEITKDKKFEGKKDKQFGYPYMLILECARLCKNQSKLKNSRCKIVYTTIDNITKGKQVGSVFTKNEKYINI